MQGFLFKIVGNEYLKNLEIENLEIQEKNKFLRSINDILFFEDGEKSFKFKGTYFNKTTKTKTITYKLIENYDNIFILIVEKSLKKGKYNLIKEFRNIKKNEENFLFYFTNKDNILNENNSFGLRRLKKFKKSLKKQNYDYMNFYGEEQLNSIVKKELLSLISKNKETLGKKRKKVEISTRKYDPNNQYPIFYILTAIGKYLIDKNKEEINETKEKNKNESKSKIKNNKKTKSNEEIAINDFLNKHSSIVEEYNRSFLENSLINSAKHLIKTGIINPKKEDSETVVSNILKEYENQKKLETVVNEIEKYLFSHGFRDDEYLKEKINKNKFKNELDLNQNDFHDFELFNHFNYNDFSTITPILEYTYQIENSKIREILEKIKEELSEEYINSYLMYISSFLFDLNEQLSYFHQYYVDLFTEGIIEEFYELENEEFEKEIREYEESSEVENDFYKEFEDDLFKDIGEEDSSIPQFIISTNDFLDDWSYYYKIFRENILKEFNINVKLLFLVILYSNFKEHSPHLSRLYILIDYIQHQLKVSSDYLNDINELNKQLNEINFKKINSQYELIRKFINKWKINFQKIKTALEILNKFK